MPEDYRQWYTMMEVEFGTRFSKLFRGPAWSGCNSSDFNYPAKARVNVAAISHTTVTHDLKKSKYTVTSEIQETALQDLKKANPNGRFWLKLDATDIKPALQESVKGVWNGDCDIHDGALNKLRKEYVKRTDDLIHQSPKDLVKNFKEDATFLLDNLNKAVDLYKKKSDDETSSNEKLKELNWEVVEYTTLLSQAQQFKEQYEKTISMTKSDALRVHRGLLPDLRTYLRNLFKKKRQPAATHVLVIMLSNEKRVTKPYAQPIQYIAYHNIKDDQVRVFTTKIKKLMVEMDMKCVGTVTDGEFSKLRTIGEDKTPTHLAQLIKEARASVNVAVSTLKKMIIKTGETADGQPITEKTSVVPAHVIIKLDNLLHVDNLAWIDALKTIRGDLFRTNYKPKTWREHLDESEKEMLQSIIGQYKLAAVINHWITKGRDFSAHVYIPAIDPVTKEVHREQEDENHLMKRIAKHVRDGQVPDIDFGRFHEAMLDDDTVLTEAALLGQRRQNVGDAERLLSHSVADFFLKKGYTNEEYFVRTVALWHEATDGRGMSQDERRDANLRMLKMIMTNWMPWYEEDPDLRNIDINIRLKGIMGFSRETILGVTANIESQEFRRGENAEFGPEHPRAGSTDDVECFFSLLHRMTGGAHVTLKDFKYNWQKLTIQFSVRMDPNLPFYVWTLSERFSLEDQPSFDILPEDQEGENGQRLTRLHCLGHRSREKSSVTVGRSTIAASHTLSVRAAFFRKPVGLPSVPPQFQM